MDAPAESVVRRATIAAVVSTVAFGIFFVASTQVGWIRAQSPWDADPWDAVISFTSQLVAGVAIVTALRCIPLILGDSDLILMRRILRGLDIIATAIALTVLTDVIGLVGGAGAGSTGAATPWLVDMLLVVAAAALLSVVTLVIAWRAIGRRSTAEVTVAPDPVALLAAWTLDRLPSPFDRPVVVEGGVAIAAGAGLSLWHTVVEGVLSNGLAVALVVTMLFAATEATGVFLLGWASARYLEIFPSQATHRIS